jgi:hypothetical protein
MHKLYSGKYKQDHQGHGSLKHTNLFCTLQALAYMNDEFMFQLFGKYKDLADAVKHPCHLNMAACMLKLNKYEEAIVQCNVVSSLMYILGSYCSRKIHVSR